MKIEAVEKMKNKHKIIDVGSESIVETVFTRDF